MDLPRPPRLPRRGVVRARTSAPVVLPAALDRLSERWWQLAPRSRALVLSILALLALALVGRGATASPWGPPRSVLVLAADLPAGAPVGPHDVQRRAWPADLVPTDALAEVPPDARVHAPAASGSVLTDRHLASGLAGLLQEDEAAVAVPRDGLPDVAAGDAVDVVTATTDGTGLRAATAARVVAVDPDFLWLAVEADRVDAVAAAGATGRVMLAVRPGPAAG